MRERPAEHLDRTWPGSSRKASKQVADDGESSERMVRPAAPAYVWLTAGHLGSRTGVCAADPLSEVAGTLAANGVRARIRTNIRVLVDCSNGEPLVAGPAQNVIHLQQRSRRHENLPVPVARLGNAMQELQDFRECIARVARKQRWSVHEWGVTCTPFMLRLPMVRQSLADLASIRVGIWPDTPWAARFRSVHDEVERRLLDVSASARSLTDNETCTADAAVNFGLEGARLAEALDRLCGLIRPDIHRPPTTYGGR
jgi:hypothetical protein